MIQGRKVGNTHDLVNTNKGSYQVFLGRRDLNYGCLPTFSFSDVTECFSSTFSINQTINISQRILKLLMFAF